MFVGQELYSPNIKKVLDARLRPARRRPHTLFPVRLSPHDTHARRAFDPSPDPLPKGERGSSPRRPSWPPGAPLTPLPSPFPRDNYWGRAFGLRLGQEDVELDRDRRVDGD